MTKPEVTAVGRLLKPKGSEPRIYEVISINDVGKVKVLVSEELPSPSASA